MLLVELVISDFDTVSEIEDFVAIALTEISASDLGALVNTIFEPEIVKSMFGA